MVQWTSASCISPSSRLQERGTSVSKLVAALTTDSGVLTSKLHADKTPTCIYIYIQYINITVQCLYTHIIYITGQNTTMSENKIGNIVCVCVCVLYVAFPGRLDSDASAKSNETGCSRGRVFLVWTPPFVGVQSKREITRCGGTLDGSSISRYKLNFKV